VKVVSRQYLLDGCGCLEHGVWFHAFVDCDRTFAMLRNEASVSWHPPLEVSGLLPEVHGEPASGRLSALRTSAT
jgi:hypothetical protein